MLKLNNLSIGYKNKVLLSGINAELVPGSVVALMGLNGSGKSTLVHTLMGELAPIEGCISWEIDEEPAKKVAMVHSELPSFQELTVFEFLCLGRTPYISGLGILKPNDRKAVEQYLEAFQLQHLRNRMLSQLSDGQKQRCCVAKAFVQSTPVIFMDEPLNHLDLAAKVDVLILINQIAKNENKTILLTIHDWELVRKYLSELWLINKAGRFLTGPVSEFVNNGEIVKTFRLDRSESSL